MMDDVEISRLYSGHIAAMQDLIEACKAEVSISIDFAT